LTDRQRENCFLTEVDSKFLPDFWTDMPKTSSDRLDFYLSGPTVRHISICLHWVGLHYHINVVLCTPCLIAQVVINPTTIRSRSWRPLFICPSRDRPNYVIGCSGRAVIHTGFHTIILVLYIGSLPNLATWFLCGRGRTLFILGSLGQRSRSPLL
jgi:hypothetical protein